MQTLFGMKRLLYAKYRSMKNLQVAMRSKALEKFKDLDNI